MISNPILHDIIKSELTYNRAAIFNLCKEIPNLKDSNLFKKDYWTLMESRQEEPNHRYYKADCVWYFDGKKQDNYYIVNEVKTGSYSILDIYKKYRTGNSGQIWVWGWKEINDTKILAANYPRKIKLIDIEYLKPLLITDLKLILAGLSE
jgi:hypothetical protein